MKRAPPSSPAPPPRANWPSSSPVRAASGPAWAANSLRPTRSSARPSPPPAPPWKSTWTSTRRVRCATWCSPRRDRPTANCSTRPCTRRAPCSPWRPRCSGSSSPGGCERISSQATRSERSRPRTSPECWDWPKRAD